RASVTLCTCRLGRLSGTKNGRPVSCLSKQYIRAEKSFLRSVLSVWRPKKRPTMR
ncbi:hypothetical protein GGF49_006314, partial [Coemansia sp. RSA 1853]